MKKIKQTFLKLLLLFAIANNAQAQVDIGQPCCSADQTGTWQYGQTICASNNASMYILKMPPEWVGNFASGSKTYTWAYGTFNSDYVYLVSVYNFLNGTFVGLPETNPITAAVNNYSFKYTPSDIHRAVIENICVDLQADATAVQHKAIKLETYLSHNANASPGVVVQGNSFTSTLADVHPGVYQLKDMATGTLLSAPVTVTAAAASLSITSYPITASLFAGGVLPSSLQNFATFNGSSFDAAPSQRIVYTDTIFYNIPTIVNVNLVTPISIVPTNLPNNTACGTALKLNGSNQYVSISGQPINATAGAFTAWVYKNNWADQHDDVLFGNGIAYNQNNSFYLSLHPAVGLHLRYGGNNQTGNNYAANNVLTGLTGWHHIATTWQLRNTGNVDLYLYLDGQLVQIANTTNFSMTNADMGNICNLGFSNNSSGYFGGGMMDEVHFYNTSLTTPQIVQDAAGTIGTPSNLVAYYSMNDGNGYNAKAINQINATTFTTTLHNINQDSVFALVSNGNIGGKTIGNPQSITASNSYVWNGTTYTTSGTYTATLTNSNGCDSSITLNLTIVNTLQLTGASSVCKGETISITPNVTGGVWSATSVHASVNASGLVTGITAGTTTIKYTLGNQTATKTITVGVLPAVPNIAGGTGQNPLVGASSGSMCRNRTFTLLGYPVGGAWSVSGGVNLNSVSGNIANLTTVSGQGSAVFNYTVTANGCSNKRTLIYPVVVCATKGINGQPLTVNGITVFPNPAHSLLTVNCKLLAGSIVITDLYGKQIYQSTVNSRQLTVDCSHFAKGVYFVSIVTEQGKETQKVIIE